MIDRDTQKPLIELEYEAVKAQSIPCLIYFQQSQLSPNQTFQETTNSNYQIFKNKVLENEIVNFFVNIKEFKQKFANEFIKLIQGVLSNKIDLSAKNTLSLDTLQILCRASIKKQIRAVGRDKYIADVYIKRDAEKEIDVFVNFEKTFLKQSDKIIDDLIQISQNYRLLDEAYEYLPQAKTFIKNIQTPDQYYQVIDKFKKLFYYDEVETIVNQIYLTLRLQRRKETQIHDNLRTIILLLQKLPFVDKQSLSELSRNFFELYRQQDVGSEISGNLSNTLRIFPSKSYPDKNLVKSANDLIKDFNQLVQLQIEKCIALVSNAGYGKTNLLCHLANNLSRNHPVILLSGQMEITSQYDLEYHIQRQLESFIPGNFANWMNRIEQISDNSRYQYLFILIDGINENSNLPLFVRLLRNFIDHIEDKRIKLIVSCRNIFWDLFSATLKPSLFQNQKIELNEFKRLEINQAIKLYFKQFNIQSSFDASNFLALRNPLLLRFFCEAYQGRYLDTVSNLELLSVFNLYIERVEAKIIEQLGLLRTEQIVGLLTKLGYRMWLKRITSLNLSELEITPEETSKSTSIYNLIRSENLIFEESSQFSTTQRTVRFLYDEFMEYIIARSWLEQLAISQELETAIEILLQEVVIALSSFSPAFGAILFLDKMLKRNGKLVNRIISLLGTSEDEFVASRQIIMLEAFERIDINNVGGELIIALDKFERIARDEIKEKLAPIIVQVLRQHPNHPLTREMISRLLEVGNAQKTVSENQKKELKSILNKGELRKKSSKDDKADLYRLPPGRYHYQEEIKLNAISILVESKKSQDFALIEEGINSLGKMELHSALTALTSLDLADDELLYKMLAKYNNAYLSEYRIYCAWLLRNRYGKKPAEYLTALLMDKDTRVHRYTFSLFENRKIEKELLISVLDMIRNHKNIKTWHLINMIKIIGKKDKFYPQDTVKRSAKLVISTLNNLCENSHSSVRLEAYKALIQYQEFIGVELAAPIVNSMKKDKDIYIRRLADKIELKS